MRTLARLALTGLAAGLLLCSVVTAASARSFSFSSQSIRAVWRALAFEGKPEFEPRVGQITCPVTLEGTFNSTTFAKVSGTQIGAITRAIAFHPCMEANGKEFWFHNGTEAVLGARPATSLPWAIIYTGFEGTLPAITHLFVRITGIVMSVFYAAPPLGCLEVYGSAAESRPWVFHIGAGGAVESLEPEATAGSVHLITRQNAMNIACPERAKLSRPSEPVTILERTTQIRLLLI
jgi:hypothetical protein